MSYNTFRNFEYLLEPVLSDLVETAKHANGFVAYCMKSILISLDALAHPDPSMQQTIKLDLFWEQSNMWASFQEMRGLNNHPQVEIQMLAEAMQERLEQFSTAIDLYIKILHERAPPPINRRVIQTGMNNHYNWCYLTNITP